MLFLKFQGENFLRAGRLPTFAFAPGHDLGQNLRLGGHIAAARTVVLLAVAERAFWALVFVVETALWPVIITVEFLETALTAEGILPVIFVFSFGFIRFVLKRTFGFGTARFVVVETALGTTFCVWLSLESLVVRIIFAVEFSCH